MDRRTSIWPSTGGVLNLRSTPQTVFAGVDWGNEFIVPKNDWTLTVTPDKIPLAWKAALTTAQHIAPQSIICGGCLRDLDNGVKHKDIDIFMPSNTGHIEDLDKIAKFFKEHGYDVEDFDGDKMYAEEFGDRITGVIDVKPNIQLIVGPWDFTRIRERMDFGICQISYDGKEVKTTAAYRVGKLNKQFRVEVERDARAFNRTVERYARIKPRYPDWTFDAGHGLHIHPSV